MIWLVVVFCFFSTVQCFFEEPDFKYENGEYWGESYFDERVGLRIPHGRGSYVSADRATKFDGQWEDGQIVHGIRFYEEGKNYTGPFKNALPHGKGRMTFENGSNIEGDFFRGSPCGDVIVTYSNGDVRIGHYNQSWIGPATFKEMGYPKTWRENWSNGKYEPQVEVFKSAVDKYEAIKVEIICKVHSQNAKPELFKAGVKVAQDILEPLRMSDQEVLTLRLQLNFTDDPFQTYTCVATERGLILASKEVFIRNPFFLYSYGDCGTQLMVNQGNNRRKRSLGRVSIGHRPIYPGQIPWQALLWSEVKKSGEKLAGFCGGTIISPYHLLTAAHCLKTEQLIGRDLGPEDFIVKLGYTSQPFDPKGQDHKVKRILIHPDYKVTRPNQYIFNDIALITLKTRIKINEYVNPVCLPSPFLKIPKKAVLTLSGFGQKYNPAKGTFETPTFLQMTESIRLLPLENCIKMKANSNDFNGLLCAGDGQTFAENGNQFTSDSCQGDSGGPLTYQDPFTRRFKLVGIVSWGSKQCGITRGSIYANVSNYLDWIQSAKLLDAVDDFVEFRQLPYDKMDNAILSEMFEYLGRKRRDGTYLGC